MSLERAAALQLFLFKDRAYVGSELFDTTAPLQIGRDRRAGMRLEDPRVEGRHCALRLRGGALEVQPLAGETFVNGLLLTEPVLITPRDELLIGPYMFRTRLHWPEDGPAPAAEQESDEDRGETEVFAAEIERHLDEAIAPRLSTGVLGSAVPTAADSATTSGLGADMAAPEPEAPSTPPQLASEPLPEAGSAAERAYQVSGKTERLAAAMSDQLEQLLPAAEAPPEASRPPPPPPPPPSLRAGQRLVKARLLEPSAALISTLPGRGGVEICAWRGGERLTVHQLTEPGEAYVLGRPAPSGDPLPENGHPGLRLACLNADYSVELCLSPGLSGTLRQGGERRELGPNTKLTLQRGDSARIRVPSGDPSHYEVYVFGPQALPPPTAS